MHLSVCFVSQSELRMDFTTTLSTEECLAENHNKKQINLEINKQEMAQVGAARRNAQNIHEDLLFLKNHSFSGTLDQKCFPLKNLAQKCGPKKRCVVP